MTARSERAANAMPGAYLADAAASAIAEAVGAAANSAEADPVVFAGEVGRVCSTHSATQAIWRIAARALDYRTVVEWSIRAGGDNCGRRPAPGALFAAIHGAGGAVRPVEWLMRLRHERAAEAFALASKLENV